MQRRSGWPKSRVNLGRSCSQLCLLILRLQAVCQPGTDWYRRLRVLQTAACLALNQPTRPRHWKGGQRPREHLLAPVKDKQSRMSLCFASLTYGPLLLFSCDLIGSFKDAKFRDANSILAPTNQSLFHGVVQQQRPKKNNNTRKPDPFRSKGEVG